MIYIWHLNTEPYKHWCPLIYHFLFVVSMALKNPNRATPLALFFWLPGSISLPHIMKRVTTDLRYNLRYLFVQQMNQISYKQISIQSSHSGVQRGPSFYFLHSISIYFNSIYSTFCFLPTQKTFPQMKKVPLGFYYVLFNCSWGFEI